MGVPSRLGPCPLAVRPAAVGALVEVAVVGSEVEVVRRELAHALDGRGVVEPELVALEARRQPGDLLVGRQRHPQVRGFDDDAGQEGEGRAIGGQQRDAKQLRELRLLTAELGTVLPAAGTREIGAEAHR